MSSCFTNVVQLSAVAPKKYEFYLNGEVPTIGAELGILPGDIVIDLSTSPRKIWRCVRNTPGNTVYSIDEYLSIAELDEIITINKPLSANYIRIYDKNSGNDYKINLDNFKTQGIGGGSANIDDIRREVYIFD
ncbi:MAG: hypothetical protein D6834_03780 [Aquificota bacterium]|nr:MAG: hypothetical protein D6834_03780 [Aquificota bacterium]